MSTPTGQVRVRFAPSPTGALHVGNARTALFNWLLARSRGGTFVLRIEDTDAARSTAAHEAAILADLRWLGLGWDEGVDEDGGHGPYRQSERLGLYRDAAARLMAQGTAYPCFCAPARLEEERAAQREAGRASVYFGRCRALPADEAASRLAAGEAHAVRFNVAAAARGDDAVTFEDVVRGPIRFPVHQIGDFVLLRRDGMPAYNFAVVVDDQAMGITDVVRGDDHLSNTPRQVLLYRALGATPPRFAHLPLIVAPGGTPLSKREGAVSVSAFRDQGYPPEALLNHLALLGWSPASGVEFLTPEELVAGFDLARVSHSPAVFDRQKLDALSARHIARMPPERLAPPALEHLARAGLVPEPAPAPVRDWTAGSTPQRRRTTRTSPRLSPTPARAGSSRRRSRCSASRRSSRRRSRPRPPRCGDEPGRRVRICSTRSASGSPAGPRVRSSCASCRSSTRGACSPCRARSHPVASGPSPCSAR
jgi:nondiscriminating glutamyl-tRNA synthetase